MTSLELSELVARLRDLKRAADRDPRVDALDELAFQALHALPALLTAVEHSIKVSRDDRVALLCTGILTAAALIKRRRFDVLADLISDQRLLQRIAGIAVEQLEQDVANGVEPGYPEYDQLIDRIITEARR